ncbi:wax ester synthase/diacylglycerol acyltransferase 11-like [Tasmannia lanceolata]|uniref:wax ester synthase/diacylglycerol acyltransferase 11-like n=1 Tax=Tasmannia lanceolata TaxID=3420 RepID=UPI0040629122
MEEEEELPVTPAGRFFLQPKMQNVIHCVVGVHLPIDIENTKAELEKTLLKHPRFCSLLVRDKNGVEHWKKTKVEIDRHVFIRTTKPEYEDSETEEDLVNRYLSDLAISPPLDETKPLWEIHVLQSHKCLVLRVHHALGDGISLISLFLACCKRVDNPELPPTIPGPNPNRRNSYSMFGRGWKLIKSVWFTLIYVLDFGLHSLCVRDAQTVISGGAGVELWPRSLATARFSLDDMKVVKKAVNGTINDVLFGIISFGLATYLELRGTKSSQKRLRITGLALVNTRHSPGLQDLQSLMRKKSKSRWGNQMGYILLPLYLQEKVDSPLEYVKRAKTMLDKKKLSLEARCSYKLGSFVMSLFGPKIATSINYNIIANTTFTISNVVGPKDEMMFAGNPITYIRTTSTSIPHAITMHMMSYMDKAEMQILVAKEIIPDPRVLAKCFQDALLEMKIAASTKIKEG